MSPLFVRFGDVVVDELRREVRRAGTVVPVQSKVLEVLLLLLRHRDRVVTRQELLDAVWPDVVVGPSSISRAIREVRKAIGDDGSEPERVKTLAGHGFRFVADVAEVAEAAPKPRAEARPALLHGRALELEALDRGLVAARGGRAVARIVSGEPGIGKSRLLDAFAASASSEGAQVVRGRIAPGDAEGPLAAWQEIVSALDVALPGVARASEVQGAESWRSQRVRALLEGLGRLPAGPRVLLIDDADRGDQSSWLLLQDVLERPVTDGLLVVLTIRPSARRAPEVVRLTAQAVREDPDALVEVRALDAAGLHGLATDVLGHEPSSAGVAKLARLSGGHPLFARHLVHAAVRAKQPLEGIDALPLSRVAGLRELVLAHVAGLAPIERALVEAAAILSTPFQIDLVAEVAGIGVTQAADGLAAATDAGLIEADALFDLTFVHEIVRTVVADALLPSVRAPLHRRAAMALDRRPAFRRKHLDLVANHFALGAADGDAERALDVLREAARAGAAAGAFDVSARHLRRAIAVDALVPNERSERATLHLELGTALARAGELEDAALAFAAAGPRFERGGSAALHAAFHAIADEIPRAVERFYELLFSRHPEVRGLFVRSLPAVQRKMFGETLGALVEHAGDDAWIDDHLRGMGARHLEYGITPEMYAWVREAFLDALDEACGRAGLPAAVKVTWARMYDATAERMMEPARALRR